MRSRTRYGHTIFPDYVTECSILQSGVPDVSYDGARFNEISSNFDAEV